METATPHWYSVKEYRVGAHRDAPSPCAPTAPVVSHRSGASRGRVTTRPYRRIGSHRLEAGATLWRA